MFAFGRPVVRGIELLRYQRRCHLRSLPGRATLSLRRGIVGATASPSRNADRGSCHRQDITRLFWHGLLCRIVACLVRLAFAFDSFRKTKSRILILLADQDGSRVLGSAALFALELLRHTLGRRLWRDCRTSRCRGRSKRGLLEGKCCHDLIMSFRIVIVVLDYVSVPEAVEDKAMYLG